MIHVLDPSDICGPAPECGGQFKQIWGGQGRRARPAAARKSARFCVKILRQIKILAPMQAESMYPWKKQE
jgi:hypothetical protein